MSRTYADVVKGDGGTKKSQKQASFDIGHAETFGRRQTMEDVTKVCTDDGNVFLALFDGHGGVGVAEMAASMVYETFTSCITMCPTDPKSSLCATFAEMQRNTRLHKKTAGSTALVAYIDGNTGSGYVANLGDSRAIMVDNDEARCWAITTDHKPSVPAENEYICNRGGFVTCTRKTARVCGTLAVSRALGDNHLDKYLRRDPDVFYIEMRRNCERALVMACDGVWDVLSNDDVADIVRRTVQSAKKRARLGFVLGDYDAGSLADEIAQEIKDIAFTRCSQDNISVLVVMRCPDKMQ